MKSIKVVKPFSANGITYAKGDEIELETKEQMIRLNELGFIGPLTMKEIQDIWKKPEYKKLLKKEED